MRLRAHHLLCIQLFDGHGYDERFTSHMKDVIRDLTNETKITVIQECDDICSHCPNREENRCKSYKKVQNLDRNVIKATGISPEKELSPKEASSLVKEKILKTGMFDDICSECEWYELCEKIKDERRKDNGW